VTASLGSQNTGALDGGGTLYTWGAGGFYDNGDGTYSDECSPAVAMTNVLRFAYGYGEHGCAILLSGSFVCWGSNIYGQVGLGYASSFVVSPTAVPIPSVVEFSLGASNSAAVTQSGALYTWGLNSQCQDGISNTTTQLLIPTILLPSGALDVALGSLHSTAILSA